jgi:UDP-glucose 4-epimerase
LGIISLGQVTVLVTGSAGFIGSHIVDHCLEAGYDVIGLDDLSGGHNCNKYLTDFFQDDIRNKDAVVKLFNSYKIDYVIHAAAYAAEGLSHFIRAFNYDVNVVGSMNLINQSVLHGVRRFVFLSSIAVYGSQYPMREDATPKPEDPYGIAKAAVEADLKCAHEMFGLNYTIFRPHNVYGERQNIMDPYRNVVGIFMRCCMEEKPLPIFGDGSQVRAFTHIDDVAPIIVASLVKPESEQQVFNVGASDGTVVGILAQIISHIMGKKFIFENLPARREVQRAVSEHGKSDAIFGPAKIDLRTGLMRMSSWVKTNYSFMRKTVNPTIEVPINLPESWR